MRAEFDESLVTGNEMIDTQHKELIDKINKLLDSCETSKDSVDWRTQRSSERQILSTTHLQGSRAISSTTGTQIINTAAAVGK